VLISASGAVELFIDNKPVITSSSSAFVRGISNPSSKTHSSFIVSISSPIVRMIPWSSLGIRIIPGLWLAITSRIAARSIALAPKHSSQVNVGSGCSGSVSLTTTTVLLLLFIQIKIYNSKLYTNLSINCIIEIIIGIAAARNIPIIFSC